jgi:uncharacterized protein YbjQ (UPF0145 family)
VFKHTSKIFITTFCISQQGKSLNSRHPNNPGKTINQGNKSNISNVDTTQLSQLPFRNTHSYIKKESVQMIMTNVNTVPGKKIVEHFGIVQGSTVRAKHVGRDFMASLKNLVGGELKGYTELLQDSREEAMRRMEEQARQMGANAVVNIRFATSSVAQGAAELFAYGTAVRVE